MNRVYGNCEPHHLEWFGMRLLVIYGIVEDIPEMLILLSAERRKLTSDLPVIGAVKSCVEAKSILAEF